MHVIAVAGRHAILRSLARLPLLLTPLTRVLRETQKLIIFRSSFPFMTFAEVPILELSINVLWKVGFW